MHFVFWRQICFFVNLVIHSKFKLIWILTGLNVGKTLEFDEKINKKSVKIFGKNRKIKNNQNSGKCQFDAKNCQFRGIFIFAFFEKVPKMENHQSGSGKMWIWREKFFPQFLRQIVNFLEHFTGWKKSQKFGEFFFWQFFCNLYFIRITRVVYVL